MLDEYKHNLYKDGDEKLPNSILDGNGQVALAACKLCGQAEITLAEECPVKLQAKIKELEQQLAGQVAYNEGFREIYEVWAGSDAFIAETAPEAYQQRLIHKMRDIAARYLNPSQDLVNQMKAEAVREAVEFKFTEKEIDIAMPQSEWVEEEDYRRFGWNSCCSAMMAYAKQLEEGE